MNRWHVLAALLFLLTVPIVDRNAAEGGAPESSGLEIDVRFQNDREIFSPQETVVLELRPRPAQPEQSLAELAGDKTLNLHVAIFPSGEKTDGGRRKKRQENPMPVTELELQIPIRAEIPWIPISLLAPPEEDVYDISISLQHRTERSGSSILSITGYPMQRKQPKILAEKKIQCVVLDPTFSNRPATDLLQLKKELLETVDSTHPDWRQRLAQIPVLPKVGNLAVPLTASRLNGFRERPSKQQETVTEEPTTEPAVDHPLVMLLEQWKTNPTGNMGSGHLRELQSLSEVLTDAELPEPAIKNESTALFFALSVSEEEDPWEAMPLHVKESDRPHLLELDYPSSFPQELGVSVVEMLERDGRTVPVITAGTGLHVVEEIVSDTSADAISTHRILFRPKTKNPILLLVNRGKDREARFGKVRLYRITAGDDDRIPKPFEGEPKRLTAAYFHHAGSALGMHDPTAPGDWQRAFEGAEHLIDLLRRSGHDGAMLVSVSKEAVLFPSLKMPPPEEKDTPRKTRDLLELLFRLFDRERLTLIPAIDFNRPLPELEQKLHENPALADELYWDRATTRPEELRYNLLHPLVQDAMAGVVEELADRYARHPSFGGMAVCLNPDGCAQLPITVGQVDDRTFEEFRSELRPEQGIVFPPELRIPEAGASPESPQQKQQRSAGLARFIQGDPKTREAWIAWRARKVSDFQARLTRIVTKKRPEATLYLVGGTMFDHPDIRQYCYPTLLNWTSLAHVLRMTGFDLTMLNEIPELVFLRPSHISVSEPDACYEQFDTADLGACFMRDGVLPGVQFFHESRRTTPTTPAGNRNRRRFVKQLAQSDVLRFFDGGNAFPVGEEDSLHDFLAAFRLLPPEPFQTVTLPVAETGGETEKSFQPVTVRYAKQNDRLIVYLLNDAPFDVEVALNFSSSETTVTELSGRRTIAAARRHGTGSLWQAELGPYDFLAMTLDAPEATIRDVVVRRPARFCGPTGQLRQEVERFNERIRAAQHGITWDRLENPDFETVGENPEEIVGWNRFGSSLFTARSDTTTRFSGLGGLKLEARPGVETETGTILSHEFEAPSTGRLFVSFAIGFPENTQSLPLHVVLSGHLSGRPWQQAFSVEAQRLPQIAGTPSTGAVRWHRMIVPFDRLPRHGLEDFRLGFRMYGPGTVWIDDISLHQVSFTPGEIKVLQRLVLAAGARCSQDRVSDLLTILEGHWAQFLHHHVPVPAPETPMIAVRGPAPATDAGNRPYADNAVDNAAKEEKPKTENKGFFDRIKGFFGR